MKPRTIALAAGAFGLVGSAMLFSGGAGAERCALIEGGAIKTMEHFADGCPPDPKGKPWYKWLPAPRGAIPPHDPQTQMVEGPRYEIGASAVTETWLVRAKTAQETDAELEARIDAIALGVLKFLCKHENDIRALRVPAEPALTPDQCRAAVKGMLK